MPPVTRRSELIVLDMPPDSPANRSIANFWFLNVSKHCTQLANNGTSYFDQISVANPSPTRTSQTSIPATSSSAPMPSLNPPMATCLNEGRRENVMLGFLWGMLFVGLLAILGLGILKYLRKARTIRQTRHNWVKEQQQRDMEEAETGLGTRGCVASTVVVVGNAVSEAGVRFAGPRGQGSLR